MHTLAVTLVYGSKATVIPKSKIQPFKNKLVAVTVQEHKVLRIMTSQALHYSESVCGTTNVVSGGCC